MFGPRNGALVFGSAQRCAPEKAIAANSAAVREWDSNGTSFGFNKEVKIHRKGEFGHNDYYPVCVAACQAASGGAGKDGKTLLKSFICLDEIRGRLAEVFSLKEIKVDHVLFGAIASAAVYGALVGATPEQIESAIGMMVAHYVPFRATRSGEQLSDSKGASAALSAEAAVLCMRRAMNGFQGPKDIFRNFDSVFGFGGKENEKESPFDLILSTKGENFALTEMHFKLGLYEHQSAGAIEGLLSLLSRYPLIYKNPKNIKRVEVVAYEPAFSIIGDAAKKNPQTRQSADHSMVYIVSTLLRKAAEMKEMPTDTNAMWCALMLTPNDYTDAAIHNPLTRSLMKKVNFVHGGPEFDRLYPQGIPTQVKVFLTNGDMLDSGLVMFPAGHSSNSSADLQQLLQHKFLLLGGLCSFGREETEEIINKLIKLKTATPQEVQQLYGGQRF